MRICKRKFMISCVFFTASLPLFLSSCATQKPGNCATVEDFMAALVTRAKQGNSKYIINHMISSKLQADLIEGNNIDRLKSLPYYFGWLKDAMPQVNGREIRISGQHGCYAVFIKEDGRYFLHDFGQKITSM